MNKMGRKPNVDEVSNALEICEADIVRVKSCRHESYEFEVWRS